VAASRPTEGGDTGSRRWRDLSGVGGTNEGMLDVASQRLKRTMRGAMTATAVIAAVGLGVPTTATAAPPTNTTPADPMQQYQQLSKQADALNEQINKAKVDLTNRQAQSQKAAADLAAAKQAEQTAVTQEDQYRGVVDQLTGASYEGARFNQLSALLTGTSTQDYLNRASDLAAIATDDYDAMSKFSTAINAAKKAEQRATDDQQTAQAAANAANTLLQQLNTQSTQLTAQITQVNQALHRLTAKQQTSLNTDIGPTGTYIAPPGVAGAAMQAALAQRGKPYRFGGAGPSNFDCSGLVDYAYMLAGMPGLPHSAAALQGMGMSVSRANLQAGDLVFFGNPAGHVGIYVGGGMMVNAPSTGQVVKVEPLFSGYSGARRLGA
jgi:cell wall-associated NlpC family hydrolase